LLPTENVKDFSVKIRDNKNNEISTRGVFGFYISDLECLNPFNKEIIKSVEFDLSKFQLNSDSSSLFIEVSFTDMEGNTVQGSGNLLQLLKLPYNHLHMGESNGYDTLELYSISPNPIPPCVE
jgi:hypothetical protein